LGWEAAASASASDCDSEEEEEAEAEVGAEEEDDEGADLEDGCRSRRGVCLAGVDNFGVGCLGGWGEAVGFWMGGLGVVVVETISLSESFSDSEADDGRGGSAVNCLNSATKSSGDFTLFLLQVKFKEWSHS